MTSQVIITPFNYVHRLQPWACQQQGEESQSPLKYALSFLHHVSQSESIMNALTVLTSSKFYAKLITNICYPFLN